MNPHFLTQIFEKLKAIQMSAQRCALRASGYVSATVCPISQEYQVPVILVRNIFIKIIHLNLSSKYRPYCLGHKF